jgi:hypothetical protein
MTRITAPLSSSAKGQPLPAAADAPPGSLKRHRARAAEAFLVCGAYLALALAITWPLCLHLETRIPGGGTWADPTGYYIDFWDLSHHALPFAGTFTDTVVNVPFGRTQVAPAFLEQIVSYGPAVAIAHFWSTTAGESIVGFMGLVSSAAAMYLLVRWLGGGRLAAGWAGTALMLCPYLVNRVAEQVPLANLACFPLALMAGIYWMQRPCLRRSIWVALAMVLGWLTHPYFGLMCMVMLMIITAMGIIRVFRSDGARIAFIHLGELIAAVGCLVIGPLVALLLLSQGLIEQSFTHTTSQLEAGGAYLSNYFWPPSTSQLMGWLVGQDWSGIGSHVGEGTAFLGWSTIALAVLWVYVARERWRALPERLRLLSIVAGPLIVTMVLLSFASPYRIAGLSIPMPSDIVFHVVPFFRYYARFEAPVMVVVVAIAALAVDHLITRTARSRRIALGLGVIALSAIELPTQLPIPSGSPLIPNGPTSAPASEFAAWTWVAQHTTPNTTVVEMPSAELVTGEAHVFLNRIWMYGQTIFNRPIVDGLALSGSPEQALDRMVGDPRLPDSASDLATVGARIAIVGPWAFQQSNLGPPDTLHPPAGYALLHRYADGTAIWRVTARPLPGLVLFEQGSSQPRVGTWTSSHHSNPLWLYVPREGNYLLRFSARMRGIHSSVRLTLDGARIATIAVYPGPLQAFVVPMHLAAGTTAGDLESQPGLTGHSVLQLSDVQITEAHLPTSPLAA